MLENFYPTKAPQEIYPFTRIDERSNPIETGSAPASNL